MELGLCACIHRDKCASVFVKVYIYFKKTNTVIEYLSYCQTSHRQLLGRNPLKKLLGRNNDPAGRMSPDEEAVASQTESSGFS